MSGFARAAEVFFDYLDAVVWDAVALALLSHLAKMVCRTRSWRNILAASYPGARIRWRGIFGAYVAGVGVNAIMPARGGDLVKLYLARRQVAGSTYPTLASTLVVETLFDFVVASALLLWAIQLGVLPGLSVLPRFPAFDWQWLVQHPHAAVAIGAVLLLFLTVLAVRASRLIVEFRARVAQGFVILGDWPLYIRQVVAWQALDWLFRLATTFWFLRAFHLDATVRNTLLVQVTQSLSTVLPFTPAGIGTEQALLVYVFFGTAPATAVLSFSIGMKLTIVAFNVLLGFGAIALMLRTLRWRRAIGDDQAVPAREAQSADLGRGPR